MGASSRTAQRTFHEMALQVEGGWCWFQDDRVLSDTSTLLVGSVRSGTGDVQVTQYNHLTGRQSTTVLHAGLGRDDHLAPALLRRRDGRYLAMYSAHDADNLVRWRISTRPGEIDAWGQERTLALPGTTCYSNLHRVNEQVLAFSRAGGFRPHLLVSDDDGERFGLAGPLFTWPDLRPPEVALAGRPYGPYPRYASDGSSVHIVTTEDNPFHRATGVYHAVLRGSTLYDSYGRKLGDLGRGDAPRPDLASTVIEPRCDRAAWTVDLRLDNGGRPRAICSTRELSTGALRYVYCCFDGARWIVYDLAPAGYGLTDFTPDYSALAALHPTDPRTVYVATNHDPSELASSPTEHIELYRGRTADGGRHWRWEALTRRSGYDNIRPVVRTIPDENRAAILWMRGDYRSMWDFDTSIVGSFDDAINN